MENIDLDLDLKQEKKTVPIKAFTYKGFICYITVTTPPLYVMDGATTTSGYIIVRYLNIDEYTRMNEVIKKIKICKEQNEGDIFHPVPQLDKDEKLTIDKNEITFSSYESFWNSELGLRGTKYVKDQLKEIIDMYHTQIN